MIKQRPLFAIFLIVFVDILAFTVILPFLPFYAEKYGAGAAQVGLLFTIFALCQFISGPTLGRLSDIYGRKPILAVSQLGTLVGFVILAMSKSLGMIYLARVVSGLTAGNLTVAQAAIADFTPPKERARAFGIIGIAFGLGFFIGPAISGSLSKFGPSTPVWAATGFSFLSILATWVLMPSRPASFIQSPRFHFRELLHVFRFGLILVHLRRPETRHNLIRIFLFNLSFTAYLSGFALYVEQRYSWQGVPFGAREVGFVYSYLGLLGIIIQGILLGPVVRRWGESRTASGGLVLQGLGYGAFSIVTGIPGLLLALTVASSGSGLVRASLTAALSRSSKQEEQGTILGVGQSLASIASVIAPIMAGGLIQHVSLAAWALFSGGAALIGLLWREE
jgi:MFS family permease